MIFRVTGCNYVESVSFVRKCGYIYILVTFEVVAVGTLDVTPYILVELYCCFRGTWSLHSRLFMCNYKLLSSYSFLHQYSRYKNTDTVVEFPIILACIYSCMFVILHGRLNTLGVIYC